MRQDIDRVLIDRDTIARRLHELAGRITADVCPDSAGAGEPAGEPTPEKLPGAGGELTLVPVLTGSIIFVSDLIRRLPLRMRIHLMSVSSYPGEATTSRGARINESLTHLPDSLRGQHVLVMDDILDSGRTLELVQRELGRRGPASLRTAVLLRKRRPAAMAAAVDYVAFDVPDTFVVGYGLDYNGYYRNLPDIVALRPPGEPPPASGSISPGSASGDRSASFPGGASS